MFFVRLDYFFVIECMRTGCLKFNEDIPKINSKGILKHEQYR
jgi:hypothetical protein